MTLYIRANSFNPAPGGTTVEGAAGTITYDVSTYSQMDSAVVASTTFSMTGHTGSGFFKLYLPIVMSESTTRARVIGHWYADNVAPALNPTAPMQGLIVVPGGVTQYAYLYYDASGATNQATKLAIGVGTFNLSANMRYHT
jgi:hypothetical protein